MTPPSPSADGSGLDGGGPARLFAGEASGGASQPSGQMEHLACFVPAWVALGAPYFPEDRARRLREVAHGLGETCWRFYADQPTGISPERIKGRDTSLRRTDTREYILRPEAAEAWFYLSRTPGLEDRRPLYRDWGWRAFAAIDRQLRVALELGRDGRQLEQPREQLDEHLEHVALRHVDHRRVLLLAHAPRLLKLLTELHADSEPDRRLFMAACVTSMREHAQGRAEDGRSLIFIFEQLCSIVCPEKPEPDYKLTLKAITSKPWARNSLPRCLRGEDSDPENETWTVEEANRCLLADRYLRKRRDPTTALAWCGVHEAAV